VKDYKHVLTGADSPFAGHFAINGSTGALIVFAPLDRETIPKYTLTVVASDSADRNPKNTSIIIR